jgi:hypothetical protein
MISYLVTVRSKSGALFRADFNQIGAMPYIPNQIKVGSFLELSKTPLFILFILFICLLNNNKAYTYMYAKGLNNLLNFLKIINNNDDVDAVQQLKIIINYIGSLASGDYFF